MDIDFSRVAIQYVVLIFSLCVHEAAHAWMANRCGDPSARLMGRLTLDPRSHIDPIGTVVMPLMMMMFNFPFLFGWAKPVPFNPRNLGNMRRDPVLIAIAGPASNLIIAFIAVALLRIVLLVDNAAPGMAVIQTLATILIFLMMINLVLMLFNMIPVPPLDGHYVLSYFLPPNAQRVMEQIGPFGIIIAIIAARPWLSASLPPVRDALIWIVTFGQGL